MERIREIPYNYTSLSDREIVLRFLGEELWQLINQLRSARRTGRSAKMFLEVLGDLWVVSRNPLIQDDLLSNENRWNSLFATHHQRIDQIVHRAENNQSAIRLAQATRQAIHDFEQQLKSMQDLRKAVTKVMTKITRADNIDFSGMARVAHVTDASDWRVEFPLVVLTPDHESELAPMVKACIKLGLTIIPRGGGTGYTGGAVPLFADTAVINLEKLETLEPVQAVTLDNGLRTHVIRAEAGVVTKRVSERAAEKGLVFAVDPTSQDACTIGGNVAMNAGGKKAVLWGTTLDNLLSWRMVTANGDWLEVHRINHNLGKIHEVEIAEFEIHRFAADGEKRVAPVETLRLPGSSLRKIGLGKDVTNKFLGGLPGIQKEGCDGLISQATFILHKNKQHIRTLCLEFFGHDLRDAVPAIVESKNYVDAHADVDLAGMEHLDERYIKAINYSTKAARPELPKMVLLIDIIGDQENSLHAAAEEIITLAKQRQAEGFIAISPEARKGFWQDRTRTAAIAAHTNAFKINEDVVIPLDKLADYSDGIERINIEYSIKNKLDIIDAVLAFFDSDMDKLLNTPSFSSQENQDILQSKRVAASHLLETVKNDWQLVLNNLQSLAGDIKNIICQYTHGDPDDSETVFRLLQRREFRISYRKTIDQPLKEIFAGREMQNIHQRLDEIHQKVRSSRLFVALHMHAGDGNVHTNIPVNSNDYKMLHEADNIVDRVMKLATSLGGVISGEHGIGITKIQYLDNDTKQAFNDYKSKADPNGHFNRGKLLKDSGLERAYTPSLRLVQQEALILEASELGSLNDAIKHCLRCGKCKPVCTTHVPRANLLYSPRNKILATGMVIEAFLYEEQTKRGISLRHFDEINDLADHCTICHRCLEPCPVNIDFGDVSINMRNILRNQNKKRLNLGTKLSMAYLNATDPKTIQIMRNIMIKLGFKAQNIAHNIARKLNLIKKDRPSSSNVPAPINQQIVHFVSKPLPAKLPKKTSRNLLGIEEKNSIPILRHPEKYNDEQDTVFYFPGCGSERLFSQIAMATLAMMYEHGTQVVLPPGYLCCGYPQTSSGDVKKGQQISTDNRVLFHRIANTLSYLSIKTVIVSCGTCMDQIMDYHFDEIFPGCRLLDIHEYLYEKDITLNQAGDLNYLYHDPCHSPMKTHSPTSVASRLMAQEIKLTDRCCGEAGTFAVARPDIATQVRFRKEEELINDKESLDQQKKCKILTSCPACQQGLSRYSPTTQMETDYIVVEMANTLLGPDWQEKFINSTRHDGIEKILF